MALLKDPSHDGFFIAENPVVGSVGSKQAIFDH